jgi:predicted nucleic acid-binding protein
VKLVVDSSVAIKWLITEADSDQAAPLRVHDLWAPELLWAEVASILWKKVRLGQLTGPMAETGLLFLRAMPITSVPLADLAQQALKLGYSLDHSPYDMFFVALALRERMPLVTADERLIRSIREKQPLWATDIVSLRQFQPG